MKLEIPEIILTKKEEKQLTDRLKDLIFESLYDDIGYAMADSVIKKNKKKIEVEIQRIIDSDYQDIAKKIVIRKLGL
jgi:hypothetical protein